MRRKIIISLFLLFMFFTIGVGTAILYMTDITKELSKIIKLYQVEQLRRSLLINIQSVQSDLYTVHTPLAQDIDAIVNNVLALEKTARKCSYCHHPPELSSRIENIQSLIHDYQKALSYYITGSANAERMGKLEFEAAKIGNNLIALTQDMSHNASVVLEGLTANAMINIKDVKKILFSTLILTFFFSILVSIKLTRFVTHPINKLVKATRRIASGDYGYKTSYKDSTEFGELAEHFNTMSIAVKDSYEKVKKEIERSVKAETALRESEERYALAARGANDGLWDWNLKTNEVYFSPRWKSMIGFNEEEIKNSPKEWLGRVHPDDRKHVENEIASNLKGLSAQLYNEHRILHKNGTYRWVLCRGVAVKDDSGRVYRMAGSLTDITERKVAEEQLLYDAFHDVLTGLPNRALFMDRLRHADKRAIRRNTLFAVLFIDMDRFKIVNDSLGHAVGDQLLISVSRRLEECLRPGETVARLGGDEFAILLEDIKDVEDVTHIIERIQKKLSLPFNLGGQEVFATASIGIALSEVGYRQPDHLLRDADIAMYHAKLSGGACHALFNKKMHESVMARMQLETDLRRAVENKEFRLHYQPIISLKTGKISGFEALVRWQHPVRGLIFPAGFIHIAEETGVINYIGEWVLNEACRQISLWQQQFPADPPLTISVNISSKQFSSHLIKQVRQVIKDTGIEPSTLILEITESMIMEDASSIAILLTQLKDMDVQLHIDDFGTGYSSLSYLHNFPLDALKIDRSFMGSRYITEENLEIVRTIATLAQNLNMNVIAEGVETSKQLTQLRTLNCKSMQGFLFSRPLESKEAENFLQNGQAELFKEIWKE